ncbi:MAG: hypothetical protein U0992_06185 [Planctomycetaceae bacterium]
MLELRKQISIFVPVSDWRAIRLEAARQRIPITELCRQWMRPHVHALRDSASTTESSSDDE